VPSNLSILSYALSDDTLETDAGRVHLREHEWVTWERLHVSTIMVVVVAVSKEAGLNAIDDRAACAALRDELCDLVDALSAYGVQIPLTLLVQCEANTYPHWHALAGDQDWLRGTFSIQPFERDRYQGAGITEAEALTSLLTDATALHINPYMLHTLSDGQYLETITRRVAEETARMPMTRQLGQRILAAYEEGGVLSAGDPLGMSISQRGVSRWLRYDVIGQAEAALMPTVDSDKKPEEEA